MKFKNLEVFGFDAAVRGMRNSYASWDKSDSITSYHHYFRMGDNDMTLMKKLYKAGGSERKFMRVIQIWCDIYAPFTWWKQFDTYKVATTELSTSTMHSITNKEFSAKDFDCNVITEHLLETIDYLNDRREQYLICEDPDLKYMTWREIINNLPESYIQIRTVNFNYETAARMIMDRRYHKLTEWHDFCNYMLDVLPYLKEIMDV